MNEQRHGAEDGRAVVGGAGEGRGWVDLARNRPGQLVGAEGVRRWRAAGATDGRAWLVGADGEAETARALEQLTVPSRWQRWRRCAPRWWVLHAVPVGTGSTDIDHVLCGPGGVFTINTKHHAGKRVDIVADTVTVNRYPTEHVPKAVFEAQRGQRLLRAALDEHGHPELAATLRVRPVIAVVGARVVGTGLPGGVLVTPAAALPFRLRTPGEVLDDDQVDAVYAVARRSDTWTRPDATPPHRRSRDGW